MTRGSPRERMDVRQDGGRRPRRSVSRKALSACRSATGWKTSRRGAEERADRDVLRI